MGRGKNMEGMDGMAEVVCQLMSAFSEEEIARLLRFQFDVSIYVEITGPTKERRDLFARVVEWSIRHNKLGRLLVHAANERPSNPALRDLAIRFEHVLLHSSINGRRHARVSGRNLSADSICSFGSAGQMVRVRGDGMSFDWIEDG